MPDDGYEWSSDPKARACAICGRVLEQTSDGRYQHSSGAFPDEKDHYPVPVKYSEAGDNFRPRCDFCFEDDPTWTLEAVPLTAPHLNMEWDAEWAMCEVCGQLAADDEWVALGRRALKAFASRYGEPTEEIAMEMRILYNTLRRSMKQLRRHGDTHGRISP